jgi:hypothetical protein
MKRIGRSFFWFGYASTHICFARPVPMDYSSSRRRFEQRFSARLNVLQAMLQPKNSKAASLNRRTVSQRKLASQLRSTHGCNTRGCTLRHFGAGELP